MQQLECFKTEGKEYHVCIPRKSLYGLKQSPRQWFKKFDSFILSIGFAQRSLDIEQLKTMLNSKFKIKDLGTANKIFGMEISRDKRFKKLFLSKQRCTEKIIE
ncbi:MDIS1-interacting receptor like kinase 2 [Gossypium australe]|uniref:MDIS1-interacting receptor like kinase 2 n=1 Tax=Gossypium australe TaxID=47621 RepID=A0A5B6V8R0_9ROSI|nr:MDIS1-interacting receptor like kinase 2 [Gossypium australe]